MASELIDGFKAAAAGKARDANKCALWLEGFDGHKTGRRQNEAARIAYANDPVRIASQKKTKAKLRLRCHSSTPRSI